MADVKVSALPELAAGDFDPAADFLFVSDMSASASKKMKASEMIRASLPYISTFWDFTTGSLLPTVSFTRASTGWRYNSSGVFVPETTDVARFQHDRTTLTPRGLLIEQSVTNQFLQSDALDAAAWTKTRTSVPTPNGSGTMDKLIEDTSGGTHSLSQTSITVVNGTTYRLEALAKYDSRDILTFVGSSALVGGAGTQRAYFNINTGALGTGSTYMTESIEDMGGGIYRCVAYITSLASGTAAYAFYELAQVNNAANYTGDGVSGTFLGGMSITDCEAETSYIPTTTAAVTRAADVALITNPQVLADQCWIVKGRTPRKISGGAINVAFQVDDGSGNNRRTLRYGTDGRLHVIATVAGVDQCDLDLGAVANDTDFAVAIRWVNNNFAASLNGGAIVTDLSGQNPLGLTAARVGRSSAGSYWNSTIRTIETRRTASDAELPLLSA
jgi:hypothetical protein